MLRFLGFFCVFAMFFDANNASAQSASECDNALIISTYKNLEYSKSDWRLAIQVDEQTYNQIKTDVGASGSIYGVPVGANYSSFRENTRNYSNDTSQSLSKEQFRNLSWTGLDGTAADAYKTCLRSRAGGLDLEPVTATDSDLTFVVRYTASGGSPNPLQVSWSGPQAAENRLPTKLGAGGDGTRIVVLRPTAGSSTLAVNSADASGFSASVVLTPLPPALPPEQRFPNKCNISETGSQGPVVSGQAFSWVCPGMRPGNYQATLSVVPTANPGRWVRVGWHPLLLLKSDNGDRSVPLNASSGNVIDVGVNAGIGTSFEAQSSDVKIEKAGTVPIFKAFIDYTYWHSDFDNPSNDPLFAPTNVKIELIRLE